MSRARGEREVGARSCGIIKFFVGGRKRQFMHLHLFADLA
jgi:hypothetical protein